jgi:hypothetical protein
MINNNDLKIIFKNLIFLNINQLKIICNKFLIPYNIIDNLEQGNQLNSAHNEFILSPNNLYLAIMQTDGNFVIYVN